MSRGKRWRSPAGLEEAVEKYFRSISRTVTASEKEGPILNDEGKPIRYREYVVAPTTLGLCEYLGIGRAAWEEYCDPQRHPEFRGAAALARDRMLDWSQQALLTRKDIRGLVYFLQNSPDLSGEPENRSLSLSARGALLEELGENG